MSTHEKPTDLALPPVLRFVKLEDVIPHEEHDFQRAEPLIKRIPEMGIWLNPPLVTPMPDNDGRYVVLDGANRCFALHHLGYPHILVQVVEYHTGQVQLDTWNHVVSGVPATEFLPDIHALDHVDIHQSDVLTAQASLARRDALAYIVDFCDEAVHVLDTDDHSLETRTSTLRKLVGVYGQKGRRDRVNTADVQVVRQLYPEATALVVFPRCEPAEIIVAARDQIFLPPGISRHIIHGRAIRINYPLETLKDNQTSLESKNAQLQAWITERFQARAIRYYAESIYMFDE